MDGSNYNGRKLPAGRDARAEDRAAVRTALLMTVVMVLVVVSVVLGLGAAGVVLPVASEFQVVE